MAAAEYALPHKFMIGRSTEVVFSLADNMRFERLNRIASSEIHSPSPLGDSELHSTPTNQDTFYVVNKLIREGYMRNGLHHWMW